MLQIRFPSRLFSLFVTLLTTAASVGPATAGVIHVPADQPRIADALAAATAGDSILVAPGVYSPGTNGEVFPLLLVSSDVSLLGSGSGDCILDAGNFGSVIRVLAPTGGRVSGFTITGGNAYNGGGIRIESGSPEIDGNVIRQNRARNFGSGIYLTGGAAPWIHHNVLWENTDIDLADPGDPHGIQTEGAAGVIEHNLLGRGDSNALLVFTNDEPVVRNNIFFENGIPGVRGRGICNFGGPATVIAHNLFFGNAVAAILMDDGGLVDVSGTVANTIDPLDGIYGNLDGDPRLVDPDAMVWTLLYDSPAIDAGDPLSPLDPDGTPADVGPFPFNQSITGVGGDVARPGIRVASAPNPFRSRTLVTLAPEATSFARVEVFDARGRRVRRLFEGIMGPAVQTLTWDGNDDRGRAVGAGVYFLRVSSPREAVAHRLVLTR